LEFTLSLPKSLLRRGFNRNGTELAGGGNRRGLTVWATADWTVVADKTSPARAIDYNPSENVLAAGARNGTVALFSGIGVETLETVQKDIKSDEPINVMRFSPDGHTLILGVDDGTIRVAQSALPIPTPVPFVTPLRPILMPSPTILVTSKTPRHLYLFLLLQLISMRPQMFSV